MRGYRKMFTTLQVNGHAGPMVLLDGQTSESDLELAAQITARYSQGRNFDTVNVTITDTQSHCRELTVTPMPEQSILKEWYL